MDWIVVLLVMWLLAALVVGYIIGRGIHLADRLDRGSAPRGHRVTYVVDNYVADPEQTVDLPAAFEAPAGRDSQEHRSQRPAPPE